MNIYHSPISYIISTLSKSCYHHML